MDSKTKAKILDELNQRIDDEQVELEVEAVRALEEFREWFFENFIY